MVIITPPPPPEPTDVGLSEPVEGPTPTSGAVGIDSERLADVGLSPREIEVLALAACGLINDAIGPELGISPRTVQKHLERVHAKLGVGTRMAAVATARALCRAGEAAPIAVSATPSSRGPSQERISDRDANHRPG